MKNLIIVVGAGGTGSHLLTPLVKYMNTYDTRNSSSHILVVDGDKVEEKNLERQAFNHHHLFKFKASSLVEDIQPLVSDNVRVTGVPGFITSGKCIVDLALEYVGEDLESVEHIAVLSCVDNNMARIRMTFGLHYAQYYFNTLNGYDIKLSYIDSGNSELIGQSYLLTLDEMSTPELDKFFKLYHEKLKVTKAQTTRTIKELKDYDFSQHGPFESIFMSYGNWREHLTKADHELSCDVVTESAPQNILTNMMASAVLLTRLETVISGRNLEQFRGQSINFNTETVNYYRENVDGDYKAFFLDMLKWSQEPEGQEVLFAPHSVTRVA